MKRKNKQTTQATKTCSKSVKQSRSKGLVLCCHVAFTLNSFLLLVISFILQYVSLGIRSLKLMFIDLHCYACSFPRLLSLLPSNAVSAASLSTRLWVIHAETKITSAPPSCLFLIFGTQLQRFFVDLRIEELSLLVLYIFEAYKSKNNGVKE